MRKGGGRQGREGGDLNQIYKQTLITDTFEICDKAEDVNVGWGEGIFEPDLRTRSHYRYF